MSQNFNMSELEREVLMQRSIINQQSKELSDLRKRLTIYELQCIPRTADMPGGAVIWTKNPGAGCWYERWDGVAWTIHKAPDLLPDEPGPVYWHIVDV